MADGPRLAARKSMLCWDAAVTNSRGRGGPRGAAQLPVEAGRSILQGCVCEGKGGGVRGQVSQSGRLETRSWRGGDARRRVNKRAWRCRPGVAFTRRLKTCLTLVRTARKHFFSSF